MLLETLEGRQLLSSPGYEVALVATEYLAAPGFPQGATFVPVSPLVLQGLGSGSHVAFTGAAGGVDLPPGTEGGLWTGMAGSLQLAHRAGDPPPSHGATVSSTVYFAGTSFLAANVVNSSGDSLSVQPSGAIHIGGQVAVGAGALPPAISSATHFPAVLSAFNLINARAQVPVQVLASPRDAQSSSTYRGVWLADKGGYDTLVIEEAALGAPDARIIQAIGLNDAGQTLLQVNDLSGQRDALVVAANGAVQGTWFLDEALPGTSGPSVTIAGLSERQLALDAFGRVLLQGAWSADQWGLWLGTPGNLQPVAVSGQAAPGLPDGWEFTFITGGAAINSDGTLAFMARARDPATQATMQGIWAGTIGDLNLVVGTGQTIEIGPAAGFVPAISALSLPAPIGVNSTLTGGQDGRRTFFNGEGRLAFAASFDFTRSGIFVADLASPLDGTATVGDLAWADDGDGVREANEPGLPGVMVELFASSDAVAGNGDDMKVGMTQSDAEGRFQFAGVTPGQYALKFSPPEPRYFTTLRDVGGDDGLDSDVDPETGYTAAFTLAANQRDRSRDAGFYLVDDTTGPGVSVQAMDVTALGAPVIVGGNGHYAFDVIYTDASGVDADTIDNMDLVVTGPHDYTADAVLVSVVASPAGFSRTATYVVPAPVGQIGSNGDPLFYFRPVHNGQYAIRLKADAVRDAVGNSTGAARQVGQFAVSITDQVPPSGDGLTPTGFNLAALDRPVLFSLDWLDEGGLDLPSLESSALVIRRTEPASGATLPVTHTLTQSVEGPFNRSARAYYALADGAPVAPFDDDEGVYTVYARAGGARDLLGNTFAADTPLGELSIDLSAPVGMLVGSPAPRPGATTFELTVEWRDLLSGLSESSVFAAAAVGPDAASHPLASVFDGPVPGGRGAAYPVRFIMEAPGGTWDQADEGAYDIVLFGDVLDRAGNSLPAGTKVGQFTFSAAVSITGSAGGGLDLTSRSGRRINVVSGKNLQWIAQLVGEGVAERQISKARKKLDGVVDSIRNLTLTPAGEGAQSTFRLTADQKGQTIPVGSIAGNGSFSQIHAPGLSVTGDVTITGTVKSLTLGDVMDDHLIQIGAPQAGIEAVDIVLDRVANTDLVSLTPIRSLTVTEWIDDDGDPDTITAPWIGKIIVKGSASQAIAGDFEADLILSGQGAPKGVTLGAATIAGALREAAWDITGDAGAIAVKTDANNVDLNFTGAVKSLKLGAAGDADVTVGGEIQSLAAVRWIGGDLVAPHIGSLAITGDRGRGILGDSSVNLLLDGLDLGKPRLGSTSIAGSLLASAWTIDGDGRGVTVNQAVASGFQASFDGGLAAWTSKGPFAGLLGAMTLGSFTALSLTGASLHVGAGHGPDGVLGNGDDPVAFATVKAITVQENVASSIITVGLASRNGIYLDADDTFAGGEVKSLTIGGAADSGTRLAASRFPSIVSINDAKVDPLQDSRFVVLVLAP